MTDAAALLERLRRRRDAYLGILAGSPDVAGLVAEAEAAERALAPVRERWDEVRGTLDAAALREVEVVVEETRRALGELVRRVGDGPPALGAILGARAARAAYGR